MNIKFKGGYIHYSEILLNDVFIDGNALGLFGGNRLNYFDSDALWLLYCNTLGLLDDNILKLFNE
jgi:hypothetical protein